MKNPNDHIGGGYAGLVVDQIVRAARARPVSYGRHRYILFFFVMWACGYAVFFALAEVYWRSAYLFLTDSLWPVAVVVSNYIPRIDKTIQDLISHGYAERVRYVLHIYTVIWLTAAAQILYAVAAFLPMLPRAREAALSLIQDGVISRQAIILVTLMSGGVLFLIFWGYPDIMFDDNTIDPITYWKGIHKNNGAAVIEAFVVSVFSAGMLWGCVSIVALLSVQKLRKEKRDE